MRAGPINRSLDQAGSIWPAHMPPFTVGLVFRTSNTLMALSLTPNPATKGCGGNGVCLG